MAQNTPALESSAETRSRSDAESSPDLYAIFGTGRSGSTWLGSIIDSHPDVIYRFEPFHRLASDPRIREARRRILADDFGTADLPMIYRALRPAFPEVSKPVFFPKNSGLTLGRQVLWRPAHIRPLRTIYSMLYTPPGRLPLVFKQVDMEREMDRLIRDAKIPVVYLLRHPCAQVNSMSRGQEGHLMANNSRIQLHENALRKHGTLTRFLDRIDQLDNHQKNALLWRFGVDNAWESVRDQPNVLVVIYENLCRDPFTWARRVFGHFGIEFHEQTDRFIRESTHASTDADSLHSKVRKKDYFNVFRNPEQSMNKWKTRLSPETQATIREIASGSPAYEYGVEHGGWD